MRSRTALLVHVCLLGTCLLFAGAAAAQSDDPPSTLTLDRMDSASRFGIQVGFDKIDEVSVSDLFVMRFNPYGQYLFPNRLVGVYGQLPISHVFNLEGEDGTGVGNLDAGAFILPFHDSSLILRLGLILPTASDSEKGIVSNLFSSFERLTDYSLLPPDYTFLRLSGATVQQFGVAFLRVDLGIDVALDKPTGASGDTLLRVNFAGGVRLSAVDLSLELVNLGNMDADGGASNMFIHTLAFGVRSHGPNQFYGGMVFPLDEGSRGEIWIFSVGYQHCVD